MGGEIERERERERETEREREREESKETIIILSNRFLCRAMRARAASSRSLQQCAGFQAPPTMEVAWICPF